MDRGHAYLMARDEVLRWLEFKLKPLPTPTIARSDEDPASLEVSWETRPRIMHALMTGEGLPGWSELTEDAEGDGLEDVFEIEAPVSGSGFFRLRHRPVPMPVDAPEHEGFFLGSEDFDL